MIKEKIERLLRRFRRNLRPMLLLWLPALIVGIVVGTVFFSVGFSDDASFSACSRQLAVCTENNPKWTQVLKCSYKTAWCDIKIVWAKINGTAVVSDLPGLPPVDEKADKELFEKLTSDEFLEKRFEELKKEEQNAAASETDDLPEKEDLKKYMEELRAKRISFEKEMNLKREKLSQEEPLKKEEENNLSGKTEK